jgi:DNA-binding transcriptional regulator LsrR (DeoR family)
MSSKGQNQTEIARTLQISESTISRDLDYLREQSKHNIKRYIDERLPEEYEKCLVGLNAITTTDILSLVGATSEMLSKGE